MESSSKPEGVVSRLFHKLVDKAGAKSVGASLIALTIGLVMFGIVWVGRDTRVAKLETDFENCKLRVSELIKDIVSNDVAFKKQLGELVERSGHMQYNQDKMKKTLDDLGNKFLPPKQ